MIRRPPRSTQSRSSAASDVYKRQPPTTSGNTVTAKNLSFDPQELTVTAGTEVTFKNEDSVTHTFTGTDFDSGDIQPGGEFKHTFATAGSYDYHCSIHPSMTGKIVVK